MTCQTKDKRLWILYVFDRIGLPLGPNMLQGCARETFRLYHTLMHNFQRPEIELQVWYILEKQRRFMNPNEISGNRTFVVIFVKMGFRVACTLPSYLTAIYQ